MSKKKDEKWEQSNSDSTTVPQKWLKERWYNDPKRHAEFASGKHIGICSLPSQAYKDNFDAIFNPKPKKKRKKKKKITCEKTLPKQ